MNCIEFGAFLNGLWLGLALTLMGNSTAYLWGVFHIFQRLNQEGVNVRVLTLS